jgi:tetratricopeptide (TPR) repeat protein
MLFVGEERATIVELLVREYDKAVAAGEPRIVSLESPQGWGKTTVLQRFYQALAARQGAPHYWPLSLVQPDDGLEARRKRVYPALVEPDGDAVMPYMWWGITCYRRSDGTLAQALADDITQLEQHQRGLTESSNADSAARSDLRRFLTSAASLGVSTVLPSVGDAKDALEAGRDLLRATTSRRQASRGGRIAAPVDAMDTSRSRIVAEAVEILQLASSDQRPFVIVIEDAHHADPSLLAFLQDLIVGPLPVVALVICASRTDELAEQSPSPSSAGHWLASVLTSTPVRSRRVSLAPLGPGDLSEIVRARAPRTSSAVTSALIARADGNPLVLESILDLPAVTRAVVDGGISVAAATIDQLPGRYDDLLAERWTGLPPHVQALLTQAALLGRDSYEPLLVSGAAGARDVAGTVDLAVTTFGWLHRDHGIVRFAEEYAFRIARNRTAEHFLPQELARVRAGFADQIGQWRVEGTLDRLTALAQRSVLRSHVGLVDLDAPPAERFEAGRSASALARIVEVSGDYSGAIQYAERAVALLDPEARVDPRAATSCLDATRTLSAALRDAGDFQRARDVLDDRLKATSEIVPEALQATAWHDLGITELDLGNYERARALIAQALAAIPATQALSRLIAKASLASAFSSLGDWAGAEALEREVIDEYERIGADPAESLNVRGNHALSVRKLGEIAEAIAIERGIADEYSSLVGPDHDTALVARTNLALSLAEAGQVDESLSLLDEIVDLRESHNGKRHPDSLLSRMHRGTSLLGAGSIPDAIADLRLAANGLEEVLGAQHPRTLAARNNLAVALSRAGQPQEAIALLSSVARETADLHGPDHPDAVQASLNLATELGQAGDSRAAIEMKRRAVESATRRYGESSRLAAQARGSLADTLLEAGEPPHIDEALDLMRQRVRELPPGAASADSDVLHAQGQLALVEARAGHLTAAIERLTETLASANAADRAGIATMRVSLSGLLREAGDLSAGSALLNSAIDDLTTQLGPKHPDTIVARANLAVALRQAGEIPAALATAEAAVDDAESLLGPDHSITLHAVSALHGACAAAGDLARAEALQQGVVASYVRDLGRDHPQTLRARRHLAEVLYAKHDYTEALRIERDVLDRSISILGRRHADTGRAQRNLALTLAGLGRGKDARDELSQAIKALSGALGPHHPEVKEAEGDLKALRQLSRP